MMQHTFFGRGLGGESPFDRTLFVVVYMYIYIMF